MTRTVTAPSNPRPNSEMSAFGLVIAAITAVVLLPLLPFLAVLKLADLFRGG